MKKSFYAIFSIAVAGFIIGFYSFYMASLSSAEKQFKIEFLNDSRISLPDMGERRTDNKVLTTTEPVATSQGYFNSPSHYDRSEYSNVQGATTPWALASTANAFDDELSPVVQAIFDVNTDDFYVVDVNFAFFDALHDGDFFPLLMPGSTTNEEVYVRSVTKKNGLTTINGNIKGMDVGYGATITYGYGAISGVIISQNETLHIKTIRNKTVIVRAMREIEDGEDDSPIVGNK